MKIRNILCLLLALLMVALAAACGETPSETTDNSIPETTQAPIETADPEHEHEFVLDEKACRDSTCIKAGKKVYNCTVKGCYVIKEEDLPLAEHSYGTPTVESGKETKICSVCGDTVITVLADTILQLDFETDGYLIDHLNSADGFEVTRGMDYAIEIGKEQDGNRYGKLTGGVFFEDKNLELVKNKKFIIEYDMMYEEYPSAAERSVFTLLPNWSAEDQSNMMWMYLIKMNSKKGSAIDQSGEFVARGINGATLYTGKVLELGTWYRITMVVDFEAASTTFYIGERGMDDDALLAIGTVATYWGEGDDKKYENVERMAFRLSDDGDKVCVDDLHIYVADKPIWDVE